MFRLPYRRRGPGGTQTGCERWRSERGQSLVEFAITAPFLILVLLALAELGHGINSYLTVIGSARDAARLGSRGGDDSALLDLVTKETERLEDTVPTSCVPGNAGVCISRDSDPSPSSVEVQVCYDHPLIIGIPGLLDGSLRMCSTSIMRVLNSG
jgi:hypothetical protein